VKFGLGMAVTLAATACSSYTPPISHPINRERQIATSPENAWRSVIRYFSDHNIPIENMDRGSFFINTKPISLGVIYRAFEGKAPPIRNQFCDCGSASITGAWSTETRILISFNIVVESPRPEVTVARVNTFFEGVKEGKVNLRSSGPGRAIPGTLKSGNRSAPTQSPRARPSVASRRFLKDNSQEASHKGSAFGKSYR
jgi:hypothetical protein